MSGFFVSPAACDHTYKQAQTLKNEYNFDVDALSPAQESDQTVTDLAPGLLLYDNSRNDIYVALHGTRDGDGTIPLIVKQTGGWKSNFTAKPTKYLEQVNQKLNFGFHKYFYLKAEIIADNIMHAIGQKIRDGKRPQRIYLTGHSQGGGIITLVAMFISQHLTGNRNNYLTVLALSPAQVVDTVDGVEFINNTIGAHNFVSKFSSGDLVPRGNIFNHTSILHSLYTCSKGALLIFSPSFFLIKKPLLAGHFEIVEQQKVAAKKLQIDVERKIPSGIVSSDLDCVPFLSAYRAIPSAHFASKSFPTSGEQFEKKLALLGGRVQRQ